MNRTLRSTSSCFFPLPLRRSLSTRKAPSRMRPLRSRARRSQSAFGFTEAKGTLHYHGQSHRVQMQGLSLAQAGASNIEATGEVV